ncbi:MAG: MFS transporter, partial [Spirochaetes bacterium]|nr:MFS transporter [Spirochaetota bacterium]
KNLMFFGAVAVPFYFHRIGLNYTRMFMLETVFAVSMIVFEIPTGVIADKFGRKISLFYGSLIFGLSFFFFGIFTSYPVLVILEITCACGMTMLSGADKALIFDILKGGGREKEADVVMSRYESFSAAGMLLSFPAGSMFAGSGIVSYRTALGMVFTATGVAIILSGFIILFVKENFTQNHSVSPLKQGVNGFLYIFRNKTLRVFSLNYAFISSLTFFMFWFYQALLVENKFPVSGMGFVSSGFNASSMILLMLTPLLKKHFKMKNIIFFTSIVPGAAYLAAGFIPGLPMAFAAIFIITNLKMLRAPILTAVMNEYIESSNRATVLSGVSMMERIVTASLYMLIGILSDISLSSALIAIGAITVVLSLVMRTDRVTASS